jgi:hypothetical protein
MRVIHMKVNKDNEYLELELRRGEEEKEELKMRLKVQEERDIEIENLNFINMKLEKDFKELELGLRRAESVLFSVNEEKEELRTRLKVHEENDIEIENLKLVNMKLEKDYKCLELELRRAEIRNEEKEGLRTRLQVYEERGGEGKEEIETMRDINVRLEIEKESVDDLINYEQLKRSPMHSNEVRDLISSLKGKRFLYILYV